MNINDLTYLLENNPYSNNNYSKEIVINFPDIHLNFLKQKNIKYRLRAAPKRYQRAIDILRANGSLITTIKPPAYSTNDEVSFRLVRNKIKTEKYLQQFKIPTPKSKVYKYNEFELAKEETFSISADPVVIKPLYGTLGKGVRMNVNEKRFEYNWKVASKNMGTSKEILVQKYIKGFEARATIMEGQIVSITVRIPPFIIGDGEKNIEELIELKNKDRGNCAFLRNYPIKKSEAMLEFLNSNKIDLTYIPKKDEKILLGAVSNLSNGGELFNITDLVSENIKELALDTVASFPGLYSAGLDIMMESFDDANPTILEVNSFPVIALAAFPTYGEPTNPSGKYIEAVISKDQFINKTESKYNIKNEEKYVQNYLSFIDRKNKQINNNYKSLLSNLEF